MMTPKNPYPSEKSTEQKVERLEYKVEDLERWRKVVNDDDLAMVFAVADERARTMYLDITSMKSDMKDMGSDVRDIRSRSDRSLGFQGRVKTLITYGVVTLILLSGLILNLAVFLRGG
jgi:hypothetical protein